MYSKQWQRFEDAFEKVYQVSLNEAINYVPCKEACLII